MAKEKRSKIEILGRLWDEKGRGRRIRSRRSYQTAFSTRWQ